MEDLIASGVPAPVPSSKASQNEKIAFLGAVPKLKSSLALILAPAELPKTMYPLSLA